MRDREEYWAFLWLLHYTGEARQDELRVLLVFQSWESSVYGDLKDLKSEEQVIGGVSPVVCRGTTVEVWKNTALIGGGQA